ncbi:11520_t:CDS:2, partial [Gigaspora rosea]
VQQQQINGSLLYCAQLWPSNNIYELQENFQLDFDAGFLEDLLDIVEIWELIESISLDQPDQIIVVDPLVTKHHGRPTTKRLKSSSKSQSYKASTHSYHTINPQDSNLRIPLAPLVNNNSNDGHALAPLVNNDSNDGYALAPLVNNDSNGSNALNNNIESHVKKVKGDIYV